MTLWHIILFGQYWLPGLKWMFVWVVMSKMMNDWYVTVVYECLLRTEIRRIDILIHLLLLLCLNVGVMYCLKLVINIDRTLVTEAVFFVTLYIGQCVSLTWHCCKCGLFTHKCPHGKMLEWNYRCHQIMFY